MNCNVRKPTHCLETCLKLVYFYFQFLVNLVITGSVTSVLVSRVLKVTTSHSGVKLAVGHVLTTQRQTQRAQLHH